MKKHLLLIFAVLLSMFSSAQNRIEIDGIWYNLYKSLQKAEVTYKGQEPWDYHEYSGSIAIPTTVTHEGVTYSVTSIGEWAFSKCRLTDITIPASVTSIGNSAFDRCSNLTDITIPASVTSIKYGTFAGCSSLTAITIPENVTNIGKEAFSDCSSLTAITIPESVTSIGDYAFEYCCSLTAINIPQNVTSIGNYAFQHCSSLTAITVDDENTIYDSRSGCNAIIETNSNTLIQGCSTTIIPENVTSIGNYAFYDCSNLTTINIPENSQLTSIGEDAFRYCCSLTAINIPKGVTNIENWAFSGCSSLTAITCGAATPPTIEFNTFDNVDKSIPIYVPTGSVEAYQVASYWKRFTNIIGVEKNKCATPTVSYVDGKLLLNCDTEGAVIKTNVFSENDCEYIGTEFEFVPTHTFTAYATKENYEDSDVATLTICWIPCSEAHESEETSILTIPSKPVLISARDGVLTLSGLAEGTEVTLYTTDGTRIAHQQSSAGEATFTVDVHQVYIVHIGDKVVKIGM